MKIFLDDVREAPEGWVRAKTFEEATELLAHHNPEVISLDHDLGEDSPTGYDLASLIEQRVYTNPTYVPPKIEIHSANPVGRANIQHCIDSINRELRRRKYCAPKSSEESLRGLNPGLIRSLALSLLDIMLLNSDNEPELLRGMLRDFGINLDSSKDEG